MKMLYGLVKLLKSLKNDRQFSGINDFVEAFIKMEAPGRVYKEGENKPNTLKTAAADKMILDLLGGFEKPDIRDIRKIAISGRILLDAFYSVMSIKYSGNMERIQLCKVLRILKEKLLYVLLDYRLQGIGYCVLIDKDIVRAVFSMPGCEPCKETLKEILDKLWANIGNTEGGKPIAGISSIGKEINKISLLAAEADKVLEYKKMGCNENILFIDEIEENRPLKPIFLTLSDRRKLFNGINQCDASQIRDAFMSIRKQFSEMEIIPPAYLYTTILEIILSVVRYLSDNGYDTKEMLTMKMFSGEHPASFNSMDELIAWAEDIIIRGAADYNHQKSKKVSCILEKIKQYVIDNIHYEMNLNHVARKFSYSPSYISLIFKKELDCYFSTFIIEQKVECAAKLLLNTDLKIFEVCEKVAYKDYKYFSRLFKRIKGVTPTEFRKLQQIQ